MNKTTSKTYSFNAANIHLLLNVLLYIEYILIYWYNLFQMDVLRCQHPLQLHTTVYRTEVMTINITYCIIWIQMLV